MNYKDEFVKIYKENIKREGADKLFEDIMKSDFFTAPASTKYHEAYEGGLVEHSVKVYYKLKEMMTVVNPAVSEETIAICGLLHDLCKIYYYNVSTRNTKDETGKWITVPYYTVDDKFPFGHGEKSVYLIQTRMNLSVGEALAIRYHMGAFEGEKMFHSISNVFKDYDLPFYLHFADMKATYEKI